MIASYLEKLKNNLTGGKDTAAEEAGLAREIEGLTENSSFADVGVEVAFRICSRVQVMKKETATLIFKQFFAEYREDSLKLIGAINCGSIGAAVYDVIAPLLAYPLLRETAYSIQAEKGGMDVDWEAMLGDRDRRIKALEEEVARLKRASESTPKPTEARKIPEEAKPSAPAAKESEAPKEPEGFVDEIHEAAVRGHTESVKFLIAKDKKLLEKKNWYGMFYISDRHRFIEQSWVETKRLSLSSSRAAPT
jgi:hypothetical protein